MKRTALIAALASRFPSLTAQDATVPFKQILAAIGHAWVHGGRIEIRGFGSFGLNHQPARIGGKQKTGETVPVPGRYMTHFKLGEERRQRVDRSMR